MLTRLPPLLALCFLLPACCWGQVGRNAVKAGVKQALQGNTKKTTPSSIKVLRKPGTVQTSRGAAKNLQADFAPAQPISTDIETSLDPLQDLPRQLSQLNLPQFPKHAAGSFKALAPVTLLLETEPNPVLALQILRASQPLARPSDAFEQLALQYFQRFMRPSNTAYELIHKVATLNDRQAENLLLTRLKYLFERRELFLENYLHASGGTGFRRESTGVMIDYIGNLFLIERGSFNPAKVVFRYENPLGGRSHLVSLGHVQHNTTLAINGKTHPVAGFNADLFHLWDLYQFLIDGAKKQEKLTVIVNNQFTRLAIYNEDKSIWIRASRHEYHNPNMLHLHFTRRMPLKVFDPATGQTVTDEVAHSIIIPLPKPTQHPAQYSFKELQYNFVLRPYLELKEDPRVRIIVRD